MGKFERYCMKPKFSVNGEEFEIDFRVRDRIELAAIYDKKDAQEKSIATIDFCEKLIMRSYPSETAADVDAFLTINMEKFISELMIAANLVKREDYDKLLADEAKKAKPQ